MKRIPGKRRVVATAVVALAMVGLAACSSTTPTSPSAASSGGSTLALSGKPLKVAVLPVTPFLLPYLAQDQGLFKKEGLDVQIEVAPGGGQAQLPLLLSGEYDLAVAGVGDILGFTAGSPVLAVAGAGGVYNGDIKVAQAAVITSNSSITRPRDLVGKSVGENSVGGQTEVAIKALVKKDGGDPSKVTFVQVPVQNSVTAAANKQVDAAVSNEPFLTQAREQGLRVIFSPDQPLTGLPSSTWFGTKQNLKARAGDIAAFVRAMQAAAKIANADPEKVRTLVGKYTKTDPALLAKVKNFPQYLTATDPSAYVKWGNWAVDNRLIPSLPKQNNWLFVPPIK